VPHNFNTYTINHVMAKGLQRLHFNKGSVEWHLNELLGCACIFLLPCTFKYIEEVFAPERITASWEAS